MSSVPDLSVQEKRSQRHSLPPSAGKPPAGSSPESRDPRQKQPASRCRAVPQNPVLHRRAVHGFPQHTGAASAGYLLHTRPAVPASLPASFPFSVFPGPPSGNPPGTRPPAVPHPVPPPPGLLFLHRPFEVHYPPAGTPHSLLILNSALLSNCPNLRFG